jgi:hypothetical protein
MSLPLAKTSPESDRRTLIPVLVVKRDDYSLLEQMQANAQQKIPDLTIDSVFSAIIAEFCRAARQSGADLPALPL